MGEAPWAHAISSGGDGEIDGLEGPRVLWLVLSAKSLFLACEDESLVSSQPSLSSDNLPQEQVQGGEYILRYSYANQGWWSEISQEAGC